MTTRVVALLDVLSSHPPGPLKGGMVACHGKKTFANLYWAGDHTGSPGEEVISRNELLR